MDIVKAYKYRIYPTAAQEAQLVQFAGCRRFVWNWALARKQEFYKETGKGIGAYELSRELTQVKERTETSFLKECASKVLAQTLNDLDKAFAAFFGKRAKFPKFKSRKRSAHSMRFVEDVRIHEQSIKLPKIGRIKAVIHRGAEGVLKSATVKQIANAWYVVIVAHQTGPNFPAKCSNPIGLDVGLETFATLSNGEKVKPPKFARSSERKTARLSRALARCERGGKRREKAKARLARHHAKIANRRGDFLHKLSARLVREHDSICIEDLNIKGLMRTKLARSFADASLSTFLHQLEYKAIWNGGQVVKVHRFFPSSKQCGACGLRATHLPLSVRAWTCTGCGAIHDRDINAAQNIEAEGLRILESVAARYAETENAHGACVSLATASNGR